MAHSILLQDWIHLQGPLEMVQDDTAWLDLAPFTDVVLYTSIKHFSGTALRLHYQSSPSHDATLFGDVATRVISATGDRFIDKVVFSSAADPLSRWLRWRISVSSGTFELCFRIWATAVATR